MMGRIFYEPVKLREDRGAVLESRGKKQSSAPTKPGCLMGRNPHCMAALGPDRSMAVGVWPSLFP